MKQFPLKIARNFYVFFITFMEKVDVIIIHFSGLDLWVFLYQKGTFLILFTFEMFCVFVVLPITLLQVINVFFFFLSYKSRLRKRKEKIVFV